MAMNHRARHRWLKQRYWFLIRDASVEMMILEIHVESSLNIVCHHQYGRVFSSSVEGWSSDDLRINLEMWWNFFKTVESCSGTSSDNSDRSFESSSGRSVGSGKSVGSFRWRCQDGEDFKKMMIFRWCFITNQDLQCWVLR